MIAIIIGMASFVQILHMQPRQENPSRTCDGFENERKRWLWPGIFGVTPAFNPYNSTSGNTSANMNAITYILLIV